MGARLLRWIIPMLLVATFSGGLATAFHAEDPIRWEMDSLNEGWASVAFRGHGASITLETESEGSGARASRIDVYGDSGLVASVESWGNDGAPTASAAVGRNDVSVSPRLRGLGIGGGVVQSGGVCLASAWSSVGASSAGWMASGAGLSLDGACLGNGTYRAVLVSAAADGHSASFRLRSAEETAILAARHGGSVAYVAAEELDRELAARAEVMGHSATAASASRVVELESPWLGSFALQASWNSEGFVQAYRDSAGTATTCPCTLNAPQTSGSHNFALAGATVGTDLYLLLAEFEWP